MNQYELGGVKFIIHEGEVYCRYSDVFDVEEEEVVDKPEEEPELPAKKKQKAATGKRRCALCGGEGHMKKTCTNRPLGPGFQEDNATGYMAARKDAASKKVDSSSLEDKVHDLYESGCSLDEVLLAFPSESPARLTTLYREAKLVAES